jgi:EAL domain-containing protein (putative c-di-GMP-specific phosphodiesterase class I)
MGIVVSVDDFGTGYSSISYLRRFPIDKLKIDRSFITNIMTSGDDAAIVQAIISLAHSLRLTVVAEGVESAEQVAFLQKQGCDQYQGHYFSRPLAADGFAALLRAGAEVEPVDDMADRTQARLALPRHLFGGG